MRHVFYACGVLAWAVGLYLIAQGDWMGLTDFPLAIGMFLIGRMYDFAK